MKKKATRRLSLSRETVNLLEDNRLSEAGGGGITTLYNCPPDATEAWSNCFACPSNPWLCQPATNYAC